NWDCIQVTAPPVPDFDSAVEGEECLGMIQFADLTSQFPDTWNWDFGDGSTSTEQNPLHQYLQDGTYSVTLEACNFIDCATYTMDVVVENTLFITWAIGTGPDTPILPGSPVLMQDQTEDAITWNWDFGNGNIAIGQPSPITFYQSEGFYDVSLTVTDVNGCSRSRTITIWVGEWIVGIADETEQANVKVAPNPAQDQVMLTYDFQGSRDLQVVVTDMVGRTISQISQTALNGYQTTLSFAGQPAGMYIVTLQSEVGAIQKQIIIQ
ncbi:MAG: PKD domain-containing protein, partial [Chitinophagales bacterium]